MTTNPQTIRRDKRMQAVNTIMEFGHFRHVPVVDENGFLVGILSQTDLLAASASTIDPATPRAERNQLLGFVPVEKIMQTDVVTADPEMDVVEAARLMREKRINCLPVLRAGHVVGIVTAFDLLAALERIGAR
ncbi:MAG: CBS domain-containing protein [Planctomycetes bacterium]|nr:CBS domain-containing protein [Planctomycetota bacterium]